MGSHAAVLQQGLDVLGVAGGRGQRAAVGGVASRTAAGGLAGLAGRTGLGVGQLVVLGDEDGDEDGEEDGTRSEQEGGAGDEGLLQGG